MDNTTATGSTITPTTTEIAIPHPSIGTTVNDWQLIDKLGTGAFGTVFKCKKIDKKDPDQSAYAMKIEKNNEQVQLLALEIEVYAALQKKPTKKRHHPTMIDSGEWTNCRYLVMSLVGPSLQELRKARPDNKFSMGTSLSIARQTLECLLQLHRAGFLHRDIKPANFAAGYGAADSGVIYTLDFGMARKFIKDENGKLVLRRPRLGKVGFRGTLKYASTHAHRGQELCRGDDIESWFYMICEFIKGKLPWNKLDDATKIFEMKMLAKKQQGQTPGSGSTSSSQTPGTGSADNRARDHEKNPRRLLLGGCPRQFGPMLDLISQIKYFERPNYEELTNFIDDAVKTTGVSMALLDWQKPAKEAEETKPCPVSAKE